MDRTQFKRHPERGSHDKNAIYAVVDEAIICHLAVATPEGPLVLPMAYGRVGDAIYFHGAIANGILRSGTQMPSACATITLVDGLVFARSHFSHSMNYRCVVVFGTLREVTDPAEKKAALLAVVDHVAKDRAAVSRAPTDAETKATRVVALALTSASFKSRVGPPLDAFDPQNEGYDCWAGVVPLSLRQEAPIPLGPNEGPAFEKEAPAPTLRHLRHA